MPHDLASRLNQPPRAWSALRRARIRFRTPRRIQNRPRGNDRRPAAGVRPCDFFACPTVRWNVRAGFFNLSRDGGVELFKLFNWEPALEFGDPRRWSRAPGNLCRDRSDQFFLGRLARRSPNPPIAGSETLSAVPKNPPRQAGSRPPNLGSCEVGAYCLGFPPLERTPRIS